MGSLEAIRFEHAGGRAKLELLEQRKLPLETEWLTIDGPKAAWTAIRDMTVRGAPAIAIAAALSLAVDLVNSGSGAQFDSAAAAAAHVAEQMDYLVTSRPTAVNLSIAATALKSLAEQEAAKLGASATSVTEAVMAACEQMLRDDVAANKTMGRHGAAALLEAAQARGRAQDGRLRVLTHCNTGSLATAAYGTALGVIRALHEQGQLEHAYCCETRPYNQGARLTAYELVHDGLPSTLICDSAAAALMAQGKVDAVVVGADRIAANGDTANKIGTFCHAVAAHHHDVPFFVAAPTTTIDPQLDNGTLIPIEERAAEEITHFKGQQVAADIGVWNPSFDVTPATLIEGIITERGMVPKASGSAAGFAIRPWLAAANGDGAAANGSNGKLATQPGFVALNCDTVKEYVAARPQLAKHVGPAATAATWTVEEVGDGNINFVYILSGPSGQLCLKQALPFVRCVGEGWPLSQDRVRIEAEALVAEAAHCPQHVPAVFHYDARMCIIAMQYLAPPHIIVRKGLIQGLIYPRLADHLASFMAETLFHTSLLALPSDQFKANATRFSNVEMCRLTEQVIFTDPYYAAQYNRHTSPQLDAEVAELHADVAARVAATKLKAKFIQNQEALLHGDLHTGSIMATEETTYVIDPEFAYYGPMAFDVGKIIANLLLCFFALDGHASATEPRSAQRAWLLECVRELWGSFRSRFLALWDQHGSKGDAYHAQLFGSGGGDQGPAAQQAAQAAFMADLWRDALGFAGAVIVRRLVGIAHVADMDSIADADVRAVCERRALRFGRRLLTGPEAVADVAELTQLAEAARQDGQQPCFPL
ncbi:translation initiation factor fusion with methylthioribose kinase [Chlorella sorokiniana]|uniref:Methylthioribose-1-phosphate isomerase n=1 Tax=Chlorella sorokiniana TaxID=3076 RepID=A0A2P6TPG4_CHLSO|nr:translation initiation factor fusion with methylthioribose kinase [Chlorella sorokiniana]|eukprot:PRW55925.1 translation initiation factor fusion with methylthioribose kinase [Chlorella sorokiniana]